MLTPKAYSAKAYSAASATSLLASSTIRRRQPTEHDVQIEILFCGICHSITTSTGLSRTNPWIRPKSAASTCSSKCQSGPLNAPDD